MPSGLKIKQVAEWPGIGSLSLVGDEAIEQWSKLTEEERACLEQRVQMACVSYPQPLSKDKVRGLKGKCKGVAEVKYKYPPLRGIGFSDGRNWFFGHVSRKPREHELESIAKRVLPLKENYFLTKKPMEVRK